MLSWSLPSGPLAYPLILNTPMPPQCFLPKVEMINSYNAKLEEEADDLPPSKKKKRMNDEAISKLQSDVQHMNKALATMGPHTACGMRCSALPPLDIAATS